MEEEKAAAYYNELTRKGEGAARFKQGLGFSSNNNNNPPRPPLGSALASSSSSFLSNFVKASNSQTNNNNTNNDTIKQAKSAALETVQNKLNNKSSSSSYYYYCSARSSERTRHRDRSPSRERERERSRRRRSRSRSREKRRRSRSRERRRRESRGRSGSPRRRREGRGGKERVDYAKLIQGYDQMTPAERVKAKMKLQLNETAKKDVAIGTGAAWERFDFDKDAPLDDEEVEAADDDAVLVKHIGNSFRFSTVEARREEQIKAAHDDAMFGTPVLLPSTVADAIACTEPDLEDDKKETTESIPVTNLLSEKVLGKQQGSWRDRARKATDGGSTS